MDETRCRRCGDPHDQHLEGALCGPCEAFVNYENAREALIDAHTVAIQNRCGEHAMALESALARLRVENAALRVSAQMACVTPADDCDCAGCSYAAEVNATPVLPEPPEGDGCGGCDNPVPRKNAQP